MCGLAGIWHSEEFVEPKRLQAMALAIAHRGPDDSGVFYADNQRLGLAHRRLSIIDPERGKQPMSSEDGALTVVFNGAIYNYLELRRTLIAKGHPIHSYSDTEVLLYAYREWGEHCVDKFIGMFAFAIWDEKNQTLFCARDRIGIKPFYYSFDGKTLRFASEIKALFADSRMKPESNSQGIADYITFQFCLNEKTMFKDIVKLEPGYSMTLRKTSTGLVKHSRCYWDVEYEMDIIHDEAWFVDQLAALIDDSIQMHLRSDVPIGAHLSGGLDSSAVVCLASKHLNGESLHTFTGAFSEGPQYDETRYAKLVAQAVGAQYHETYISGGDFSEILPRLMFYMDEPLAGPGVIPQYYVSKLAAQHVKVALGGQGGDELFIGYARYMVAYLEQCIAGAIDSNVSENHAVTLDSIVPNLPLLQTYKPMVQHLFSKGLFGAADSRYFALIDRSEGMSHLFHPSISSNGYSPFSAFQAIFNRKGLHSFINQMTYFDLKGSLPALLHVEDRTSMAASMESRVPLLDHRLVEFMAKIPPNIKFAGGRMKHLFKEAVINTVPKAISERTDKMGFPTPLTEWTKGSAKDFVMETICSQAAANRDVFNIAEIKKILGQEKSFGRVVWGLLCMELWHKTYIDGGYRDLMEIV